MMYIAVKKPLLAARDYICPFGKPQPEDTPPGFPGKGGRPAGNFPLYAGMGRETLDPVEEDYADMPQELEELLESLEEGEVNPEELWGQKEKRTLVLENLVSDSWEVLLLCDAEEKAPAGSVFLGWDVGNEEPWSAVCELYYMPLWNPPVGRATLPEELQEAAEKLNVNGLFPTREEAEGFRVAAETIFSEEEMKPLAIYRPVDFLKKPKRNPDCRKGTEA